MFRVQIVLGGLAEVTPCSYNPYSRMGLTYSRDCSSLFGLRFRLLDLSVIEQNTELQMETAGKTPLNKPKP